MTIPRDIASTDARLARRVAEAAGERLLAIRAAAGGVPMPELKDRGDRGAQEVIAALLAEHRPGDAVLSEEAKDDPARVGRSRVWIIDPLDGTREFAEGRDDWAVHVALWVDGELALGAVAIPGEGLVVDSATVAPLPPRAEGPLRIAVSRTRPPAVVRALAAELGAELLPMGSAGVKISAVTRGVADAYVHGGGQFEWDSAAPVAVARAAGAHASRLDGSPLVYNRPDPYLPDLVVCRPEFRDTLLDSIAHASTPGGPPDA